MTQLTRVNWWPSEKCAKAFWSQQDVAPYRQLLADTIDWAAPTAGERWLDLGCGSGPLTRAIWKATGGTVAEVVGVDCAAVNATAYEKLHEDLSPPPGERVRFVCLDFSAGLSSFRDASFDHVVSGLSISYAESYDDSENRWTSTAYNALLKEVFRVIRPGGRFVFSVNVPEPSWGQVAWRSIPDLFRGGKVLRSLKRGWRMMRYGKWLKHEARAGRFHYFPADEVERRLRSAGFAEVEHRLSYAGQAFVFRAYRPVDGGGRTCAANASR